MVRHISDVVAVMYLGKIVEIGPADDVYERPTHPYTQALLSAVPVPDPRRERQRRRILLAGRRAEPGDAAGGCRFHTRCPLAEGLCVQQEPPLAPTGDRHHVGVSLRAEAGGDAPATCRGAGAHRVVP